MFCRFAPALNGNISLLRSLSFYFFLRSYKHHAPPELRISATRLICAGFAISSRNPKPSLAVG